MPKPVCAKCACFFRPKTNGFAFVEGAPFGNVGQLPAEEIRGHRKPDVWAPYKLWVGDLWACPDCGAEVVVGCAAFPVAEHYQPEFPELVKRCGAELTVNDC